MPCQSVQGQTVQGFRQRTRGDSWGSPPAILSGITPDRAAREITKTSRGRSWPLARAPRLLQNVGMKRPALKNFRRIVVKVGSSLLIDSAKGELRASWLKALAADIARLHGGGREVAGVG